ncbi:MAG: glucokinase [Rhizobiales bacterium]|nr:glucokinase [Hyphomicrobiales bacterium]
MIAVSDRLDFFPFPALIGDIGGTNARFALMTDALANIRRFPIVKTRNFDGLKEAIEMTALNHTAIQPRTALLAVAGPVRGDSFSLTNCPWTVEPMRLIEELGFEVVVVLNDFEALALALPALLENDLEQIGNGTINQHGTKLVVGPGTGLGAAALVFARDTWVPLPGEGGHINFGPITDLDFDIWRVMEPTNGRISAETFLSGPGILRLYRAMSRLADEMPVLTTAAEVTRAALDNSSSVARETLELFCSYLGRFAGDMAMFTMAKGGVYLGGGIVPRILPLLQKASFREAFEAKAPHDDLLGKVATSVITHPNPALEGLATYARTPSRFAVELRGRRWAR